MSRVGVVTRRQGPRRRRIARSWSINKVADGLGVLKQAASQRRCWCRRHRQRGDEPPDGIAEPAEAPVECGPFWVEDGEALRQIQQGGVAGEVMASRPCSRIPRGDLTTWSNATNRSGRRTVNDDNQVEGR